MRRLFLFVITLILLIKNNHSTPLDDFVNQPDPAYDWNLLQTYPSPAYTVYILNMTSQTYFNSKIFDVVF